MSLQVLQDLKEGCKQPGYRPGFSISNTIFHLKFLNFSFGFLIIKPEEQILETLRMYRQFYQLFVVLLKVIALLWTLDATCFLFYLSNFSPDVAGVQLVFSLIKKTEMED